MRNTTSIAAALRRSARALAVITAVTLTTSLVTSLTLGFALAAAQPARAAETPPRKLPRPRCSSSTSRTSTIPAARCR
ncbi:MAG: hypothetical protein IPH86_18550 [bacterium]|nr:hypothetical protein [bacterium]